MAFDLSTARPVQQTVARATPMDLSSVGNPDAGAQNLLDSIRNGGETIQTASIQPATTGKFDISTARPATVDEHKGFLDTVGANMQKRMEAVKNAPDMLNKGISAARYAVGGVGDIAGAALQQIPTTSEVKNTLASGAKYISELPVVQKVSGYLNENPTLKNAVGLGTDTLGAVGTVYGGNAAVKAAAPIVKDVAATGKKAISEGTEAIASGTAKALAPSLDAATKEIVGLAVKHNVPVKLSEISNGKFTKSLDKIGESLAGSGEEAFRDKQLSAWNKGVLKTVGVDSKQFTPKVMDAAFKKVGKVFDGFANGKTFEMGADFTKKLDEIRADAPSLYTQEAIKAFENEVKKVMANVKDGKMSGDVLSTLRSNVNGIARKTQIQGAGELMHDLEDAIISTVADSSPESVAALSKAKQQYKNLIAIEPIANKAQKGRINPALLQARVQKVYGRSYTRGNAGDIGELARIGRELLPASEGSDTAIKSAILKGASTISKTAQVGLGATLLDGGATAGVLGLNRLYQSGINRNQSLVKAALKKPTKELP